MFGERRDTRNAILVLKDTVSKRMSFRRIYAIVNEQSSLCNRTNTVRSRAEFIETTFVNGGQYNGAANRTMIDIHVEPRLHGNNNNRDDSYSYLFADNIGGVLELDNCSLGPFQLRNGDMTKRIPCSFTILGRESDYAESTHTVGFGFSKRTNSNCVRSSKKSDSLSLDTCFVTENNRFILRNVAEYRVVSTPSLWSARA